MFTGDDFNYVGPHRRRRRAALRRAAGRVRRVSRPNAVGGDPGPRRGDPDEYRRILGPTEALARHVFAAPTFYYKTGVAFLSWLNGHQPAFSMVGGLHSARSLPHLSTLVRLADAAGCPRGPRAGRPALERAAGRCTVSTPRRCGAGMTAHPRLSLNQATIKYADLPTACGSTAEAGIAEHRTVARAGRRLRPGRRPSVVTDVRAAGVQPVPWRILHRGRPGRPAAPRWPRTGARSMRLQRWPRPARPGRRPCSCWSPAAFPTATGDLPAPASRCGDAVAALVDDAGAAGVTLAHRADAPDLRGRPRR